MKIKINAKDYKWSNEWISYEDVLNLIGEKGDLTVQYHSEFLGNKHDGILTKLNQVIASHGMIIDAVRTDNA